MWKCPICQKENEGTYICSDCGYDESCNYIKYGTIIRLPEKIRLIYKEKLKPMSGSMLKSDENKGKNEVFGIELKNGICKKALKRDQILAITFSNRIEDAEEEHWDVSEKGDRSVLAWVKEKNGKYDLYIAGKGGIIANPNCRELFKSYTNLQEICGLQYLDTSYVTNMGEMFCNCFSLIDLDVSNFNTSQVTNMNFMFARCSSLKKLDVSKFNTSYVINMNFMFARCSSLKKLDVSKFNTNSVIGMSGMFEDCSSLENLDVSKFNTSQVTAMNYMFYNCSSLVNLDVSKFNTSQVTDMRWMFCSCSNLMKLDVSNFNTSQVTAMSCMFENCSSLKELNVSNFNTSQVTAMSCMFKNCFSLKELDVSNFDTSRVTDITDVKRMFSSSFSLTESIGLNYEKKKSEIVNNKAASTETIYGKMMSGSMLKSNEDKGKNEVFGIKLKGGVYKKALKRDQVLTITFSNRTEDAAKEHWDVSEKGDRSVLAWVKEKNGKYDFYIAGRGGIIANPNCRGLFKDYANLQEVQGLKYFDTSQVTDMRCMFSGCSSLRYLDLSNFNTSQVRYMREMFKNCSSLKELDVSNFMMKQIEKEDDRFKGLRCKIKL